MIIRKRLSHIAEMLGAAGGNFLVEFELRTGIIILSYQDLLHLKKYRLFTNYSNHYITASLALAYSQFFLQEDSKKWLDVE
jgi:hypothetical protein